MDINQMAADRLNPIPLDFIVGHALTKPTEARRQPYIELVRAWAEHEEAPKLGREAADRMLQRQAIDAEHMPKEFTPIYRQPQKAALLMEIIRRIDRKISTHEEDWTWAHVMRVMTDEGIMFGIKLTPNRFDTIISNITGKGRDNIRKSGDYGLMNQEEPWTMWPKESYLDPTMAAHRTICMMIAQELSPILGRKVPLEY